MRPAFLGLLLFCLSTTGWNSSFNEVRAFRYLEKQCSFGPRVPNSKAHKDQLRWMKKELLTHKGAVVRLDSFQHFDKKRDITLNLTNVSVVFKGKGNGRRLFCAHWDCRPWADSDPNPLFRNEGVPGANDGASGVAVLMEVCHSLAAKPPPVTIEIVFFDGEDYGMNDDQWCIGSKHFAKNVNPSEYSYAILLDMIGDSDLRIPMELNSLRRAPQLTNRVFDIAEKLGLKAFVKEKGLAIYDDHIPLLDRGIPTIDLIDFDYPYWHTVSDTPDKCSPQSLREVGLLVLHLAYE